MSSQSLSVINRHSPSRLFHDIDKRERKRQQNRVAQQTYRRNQKQRIKALEEAVANSSTDACITALISPPETLSSSTDVSSGASASLSSSVSECHPAVSCDDQATAWALNTTWIEPTYPPEEIGISSPASSDDGRTALHRAVSLGNAPLSRVLLDHGADVQKQDGNGSTALHLAAEIGCVPLVRMLLEKSPDVNKTDFLGRNPLFSAILGQHEAVAKLLLDNSSIDVNARDTLGNVPLHIAVECGSETFTILLLKHGANIDA